MKIKMQQQQETKSIKGAFDEFTSYCMLKNLAKDSIIFYENCFRSLTRFLSPDHETSQIDIAAQVNALVAFKEGLTCSSR